jgi:CHRD domain
MRFKSLALAALTAAPLMLLGANASAEEFSGKFSGFEETGPLPGPTAAETGAILSPGTATVSLDLNRNARTITFKLTYSGLSAPVTQAHIHFGKRHVPGGIMVFFCTNIIPPNGPAGTQACPASGGTVTGMFTGASVVGPKAQNINPGDFDALVAALESNTAYGNIHTMNFPSGEIRAQIRERDRDDKH